MFCKKKMLGIHPDTSDWVIENIITVSLEWGIKLMEIERHHKYCKETVSNLKMKLKKLGQNSPPHPMDFNKDSKSFKRITGCFHPLHSLWILPALRQLQIFFVNKWSWPPSLPRSLIILPPYRDMCWPLEAHNIVLYSEGGQSLYPCLNQLTSDHTFNISRMMAMMSLTSYICSICIVSPSMTTTMVL